jgi:hypothetical protein
MSEEPYKTALANVWRAVDITGMTAHYLATDAVARAFAGRPLAEINTDDRNIVEFGLARSVGRGGSLVSDIRDLARTMGASHPPLDTDAGIRWPAVDTAWANFVGWDISLEGMRTLPPVEQQRQEALRRYYQSGDIAGARNLWRQQSEPPRDPSELAMAADLEAEAGSDTALPLIEQLRTYQPIEADTALATLRLAQSRFDEAAAALEAVFVRSRVDPWPPLRFKQKALALAEAVGVRNPASARRLFDALRQPFSVDAVDTRRLLTAAGLAMRFDFKGACREPVGVLEPHVPWTATFLVMRRDCYQATGDPRLATATRDLNDFFAHEPLPLVSR